ncbi:MAG TPA: hypothetical protein VFL86_07955 [Burkholderiaceae bacterium]|nr:hypothetical protein [Burkholderiaceae bacterium]
MDASVLADKLMELADQDHGLARELHQWRKSSEPHDDPAALKALISDMLNPGHKFVELGRMPGFVRRAQAVLPLLQQARGRSPKAAVALCLHALQRGWHAFHQVDDSDNEFSSLCQEIGGEWVLALQAAGPQPASFGDAYLQVQLDDPFDSFDSAAAEAALGEPAMARYAQALKERWRAAKDAVLARKAEHAARVAGGRTGAHYYDRGVEREMRLMTLERLHIAELERAGRVDDVLAVMREDLYEASSHSVSICYLEKLGRFAEAAAWARDGCQAFPGDWRLEDDLLRCLERDGSHAEALVLRRQQFERDPTVPRFQAVLATGHAAGQDMAALRQGLFDFMAARERAQAGKAVGRDVTLRAEVLAAEERWDEACAVVQPPATCRIDVLRQIARHLPAAKKDDARALLLRVFEQAMLVAKNPYRFELALVQEIGQTMDFIQRADWLAQVRSDHRAKRTFVRDLPALK